MKSYNSILFGRIVSTLWSQFQVHRRTLEINTFIEETYCIKEIYLHWPIYEHKRNYASVLLLFTLTEHCIKIYYSSKTIIK